MPNSKVGGPYGKDSNSAIFSLYAFCRIVSLIKNICLKLAQSYSKVFYEARVILT